MSKGSNKSSAKSNFAWFMGGALSMSAVFTGGVLVWDSMANGSKTEPVQESVNLIENVDQIEQEFVKQGVPENAARRAAIKMALQRKYAEEALEDADIEALCDCRPHSDKQGVAKADIERQIVGESRSSALVVTSESGMPDSDIAMESAEYEPAPEPVVEAPAPEPAPVVEAPAPEPVVAEPAPEPKPAVKKRKPKDDDDDDGPTEVVSIQWKDSVDYDEKERIREEERLHQQYLERKQIEDAARLEAERARQQAEAEEEERRAKEEAARRALAMFTIRTATTNTMLVKQADAHERVTARKAGIEVCFKEQYGTRKSPKIVVTYDVQGSGRVADMKLENADSLAPSFVKCVMGQLSGISFASHSPNDPVRISYTMNYDGSK